MICIGRLDNALRLDPGGVTLSVLGCAALAPGGLGRSGPASSRRDSLTTCNLMAVMAIAGPGIIVMVADNDAGGITTYTVTGAQYGMHLLWFLILLGPVAYFVQEMTVRLGAVTKRGHAEAIFTSFGRFWGWFSLLDLVLTDWLTMITEFIGMTAALSIFHVPPVLTVLICWLIMGSMILTGQYWTWEKITLGFVVLNLIYIPAAFLVHPSVPEILHNSFIPHFPPGGFTNTLFFLLMVAGQLLQGTNVDDAAKAAGLLIPQNRFIGTVMAIGLFDAGLLGAVCISLASSWAFGEVFGWAHSLNHRVREAPWFYAYYFFDLLLAGTVVLIPKAPLVLITLFVQVIATTLLPAALVFLILLLNDKKTMGKYTNTRWQNIANVTIVVAVIVTSTLYGISAVFPDLFH